MRSVEDAILGFRDAILNVRNAIMNLRIANLNVRIAILNVRIAIMNLRNTILEPRFVRYGKKVLIFLSEIIYYDFTRSAMLRVCFDGNESPAFTATVRDVRNTW
jgi:hypothetical protein